MFNFCDLGNILRSISGYIINPVVTYEKNRNKGYSHAVAIFVILYSVIWFLSKSLLLINDILCGRTIDLDLLSLQFMLYQALYVSIEILVVIFVIYSVSKFENKNVNFVNSFKITFIRCAFFIFILGLYSVINAVLNLLNINYGISGL